MLLITCGIAIAPNKAGVIWSKPGFKIGLLRIGTSQVPIKNTPRIKIKTVTIEETPTQIIAITSPDSVPYSTPAIFWPATVTGIFMFVMLPVIEDKYIPPAPKIL